MIDHTDSLQRYDLPQPSDMDLRMVATPPRPAYLPCNTDYSSRGYNLPTKHPCLPLPGFYARLYRSWLIPRLFGFPPA